MNRRTTKRIDVSSLERVFDSPNQSRHALESVGQAALTDLGRAIIMPAAHLLPTYETIRRSNWKGAGLVLREHIDAFRLQAEALTDDLVAKVLILLRQARLDEQRLRHVARSPLYQQIEGAFSGQHTEADWAEELTNLVTPAIEADQEFTKAVRRLIPGPKRRRSYDGLVTECQRALEKSRDAIIERCRRKLCRSVAAHVQRQSQILSKAREGLLALCAPEKEQMRDSGVKETRISTRRTSADHDTSIPPARAIVETYARQHLSYVSEEGIDWDRFWAVFGTWSSARGLLAAEDEDPAGAGDLPERIRAFIRAKAEEAFAGTTLSDLYARTNVPVPLQELMALSDVPVRLLPIENMGNAYAHAVRAIELPRGVDLPSLGADWHRSEADDPNRISLVQDLQGFSARAFLGVETPEWRTARADKDAVLYEAATPPLQDAVRSMRILERIEGERADRSRTFSRTNGAEAPEDGSADSAPVTPKNNATPEAAAVSDDRP